MIAIDLDGTLLAPDGTVRPRTKAAVHAALGAGLLVCFATGRNWTESRTILDAVAHYDTAVFVGGAMVMDTRQRITLHRTAMQPSLARELCTEFVALGHSPLALQDHGQAGMDYLVQAGQAHNDSTKQWMRQTAATLREVADLALETHEHTIRVGIVADPAETRRIQALVMEKFAGRIVSHSLHVPAQDVEVLEVFDPAVNKWEGILHVARRHGISPAEIVAIGDDVNDVPMLKNAGLGVAMGNARPEALAAAKLRIGSNIDDGLAAFLEKLVAEHIVSPVRAT